MSATNLLKDRFKMRSLLPAVTVLVTAAIGPGVIALEDAALPTDAAAERDFMEAVGPGFRFARSDHFVLAYDVDEDFAYTLLGEMELTRRRVLHFCETYELPHKPLTQRLEAFCSKDPEEFSRLGFPRGEFSLGMYDPKTRRTYFDLSTLSSLPTDAWDDADGAWKDYMMRLRAEAAQRRAEAIELAVRHEAAHQLLANFCPAMRERMPEWLAEGLACAFEPRSRGERDVYVRLNRPRSRDTLPFGRLQDPKAVFGGGQDRSDQFLGDALDILRRGSFPDLTGLSDQLAGEEAAQWYGISWALVFVLQNDHPEVFKSVLHAANAPAGSPKHVDVRAILERKGVSIDSAFEERYEDLVDNELVRVRDQRGTEPEPATPPTPGPRP